MIMRKSRVKGGFSRDCGQTGRWLLEAPHTLSLKKLQEMLALRTLASSNSLDQEVLCGFKRSHDGRIASQERGEAET